MTHFLYWVTHFTHGLHFCESEEQTLFFFFQWRHKIWLNLCYFENVRFITSVRGTTVLKLGHPKLFQLRARQMKYICPCIHCRTEKQIPLLVDTNTYTYTVCAGEESTREGGQGCQPLQSSMRAPVPVGPTDLHDLNSSQKCLHWTPQCWGSSGKQSSTQTVIS